MRNLLIIVFTCSGCFAFMTKQEGAEMKQQLDEVRNMSTTNEQKAEALSKKMDDQLRRLKQVVDEATKVVTRNSADIGLTVEKLQTDLAQLTGRIDDLQHSQDALTKQFQDYRAASDTKLEQLVNNSAQAKNPPMPETPDALFAEGEKRMAAQQWQDARRLYEGFVNRYPQDPRAARAQYSIGEAYAGEKRYANAIGAYTKVVDNFPKSDIVPDAMYKNGTAFYQLKYCSDAKVYFQELLKRYPKNNWKTQVNEQLKSLAKDLKNKAACSS